MVAEEVFVYCHVNSKGELKLYNREGFFNTLREKFNSTSGRLVYQKEERAFSNQWRRYYFKFIVREMQKAMNYAGIFLSLEDVDYYLRNKFLFKEEYDGENDVWHKTPHTLRANETLVTAGMFKEYCMHCIWFAAEYLNWNIPYINENTEENGVTETSATIQDN